MNERILNQISIQVAEENWERTWGYGLHHVSAEGRANAIKAARAKVDKWAALLAPAFETTLVDSEPVKSIEDKIEDAYEHIDDHWGSAGWAAAEYLKTIL